MSLVIYLEGERLPEDKRLIRDVETWFVYPKTEDTAIDVILENVEGGRFYDDTYFTDRFGGNLYWEYLSTGAKAAVLAHLKSDYVVDFLEAGDNVLECMVVNRIDGNILIDSLSRIYGLPCYDAEIDITYRGVRYNRILSFKKSIEV